MYSFFASLLIFSVPVSSLSDGLLYPEYSKVIFTSDEPLSDNALFGFGVAYLPPKVVKSPEVGKRLIITSPRWKDRKQSFSTGAVFSCDLSKIQPSNQCSRLNTHLATYNSGNKYSAHEYWLGATVKAGPSSVITCAPRLLKQKKEFVVTQGECYRLDPSNLNILQKVPEVTDDAYKKNLRDQYTTLEELIRMFRNETVAKLFLRNGKKGTFYPPELLANTLGWSLEINDDNNYLIGGAAMSIGRVMYKKADEYPALIHLDNKGKSNGAVVKFNFGYSVASGSEQYAVSSPYGEVGKGKVLLFDKDFRYEYVLLDDQVGTLFGASLCSLGEAWLVGSPLWYNRSTSERDEVGAVHVYVPKTAHEFTRHRTITEKTPDSHFGSVIIRLGDLTGDKIDEIAIGVPYEEGGRGAVYIYSGAQILKTVKELPKVQYLQKIVGENTKQNLGLSITTLKDFDENGCDELVIGMPGENKAMMLRCPAFTTVHLKTDVSKMMKDRDGFYFDVDVCLDITYQPKPVNITTKILLSTSISPNHTTTINKCRDVDLSKRETQNCQKLKMTLLKGGDYDLPITLNVTASVKNTKNEYDPNEVILSEVSKLSDIKTLWGPGSDLSLDVSTTLVDNYRIGSSSNETVTLTVGNSGNIAYHACTVTTILGPTVAQVSKGCWLKKGNPVVTCEVQEKYPLKTGDKMISTITLVMDLLTSSSKNMMISTKLYKVCPNKTSVYLHKNITRQLTSDNNVVVSGTSYPDSLNVTKLELEYGNTKVNHYYTIHNHGATNWDSIKCTVNLPANVGVLSDDCVTSETDQKATCYFKQLAKNSSKSINIQLFFTPGATIGDFPKSALSTRLEFQLGADTRSETIDTRINLITAEVPIWVIIVSVIVGIILVILFLWALYELNCCRRKNRELTEGLKRDIKRQTVLLRQSLVIPHEEGQGGASNEAFAENGGKVNEGNATNGSMDDTCSSQDDIVLVQEESTSPKKDKKVIGEGNSLVIEEFQNKVKRRNRSVRPEDN